MIVKGCDPAAQSCGYAIWSTMHGLVYYSVTDPGQCGATAIAVEGAWIGPMSKQAMWTLGFRARGRLEAMRAADPAAVAYALPPRVWRALHWPSNGDRLPKDVIVERLRQKYRLAADVPADVVEACGIAEALAMLITLAETVPARRKQLAACDVRRIDAGAAGTARVRTPKARAPRRPRARRVAP